MSLKLKICGMREPDNIQAVAELQPDFMGFIFYNGSPRCVTEDFKLRVGLQPSIKKVGVFVNHTFKEIGKLAKKHSLDIV
ncbi:MAG TPA: phosphoribosylanthranilate isomerase, partial [Cyclobacteriaceae bacterium]